MTSTHQSRLKVIAIALLAAASLSACASTSPGSTAKAKAINPVNPGAAAPTPLDQFRAAVRPADNKVALAPHAGGVLSDAQRSALMLMTHQLDDSDNQIVEVRYAKNAPEGGDAARTARSALEYLQAVGVAPARLKLGRFDTDLPSAPVVVSYQGIEAYGPDCTQNWDNLAATGANRTSKHFGCATAANLAAMIADPRDLVRPAPEGPADASRRGVVFGKYRKGEATSTAKDEQASGAVSQTVK